jgi:hypothetical protein
MAEYIEREALLKEISRRRNISKTSFPKQNFCVSDVLHSIYDAPAADVVEVRHGEWIEHIEKPKWLEDDVDIYYECSVCGASGIGKTPYCHNCGAKMDRKGEGECREY